jgi:mannosyl-oligosaccharide alpha-1,2-mannosidase
LNEEFDYAVNFIENQLCINKPQSVNIFETVIRVLGGLLSGYHLSKNPVLLSTAQELTDRLLPAFDTPYSFPKAQINLRDPDKSVSWDATVALAEVGSNILEFSYLSKLTNDAKYETIAKKILKSIFEAGKQFGKGYYPTNIRLKQGQFPADNLLSFAGKADSFFEYLVKYSILENSRNSTKKYLDAYNLAMKTMLPDLLVKSRDVAYLSDANVRYRVFIDSLNHVSHLSCFAPGLFALESAWTGNETRSALSKILLESCIKLYKE